MASMNPLNWFKKHPTVKQDYVTYTSGGKNTYTSDYNDYIESVEALDRSVRIVANVASMARMDVYKKVKNELKPLKVKNIDLDYGLNEFDSQTSFIRKVFASIFTQGASFLIAEENRQSKLIHFYVYDPARFKIESSENSMIEEFLYTSESGVELSFTPDQVIYTQNSINVSNLVYATSRLKPMNDLLILQANIMTNQKAYYASGSKKSAIVSPKEPISKDNALLLKASFDEFLQSSATKTLFMNTDVNVDIVSNSESPEQIMKALTQINQSITEMFGIPPYLYGNYDGYVNDAAVTSAARLFFQIQLKPVFEDFAFQMTKYFRNTLGIKQAEIHFDYTDVEILEDSLNTKIDNASKLYKLGAISMNELREAAELEPVDVEAANKHFLPAYLVSDKPIAIEEYDSVINELFSNPQDTPSDMPSGSSGGADNTNLDTGSRGGPQENT
jgi:HK97 family phage portal protein